MNEPMSLTDAQLLERFLQQGDEAAFEMLMRRHGPMVFGVCLRVLRHAQDAEDASQATFLTLARKVAKISRRESVGSWLGTVAYRIALRLKMQSVQRTRRQRPLQDVLDEESDSDPVERTAWHELRQRLDAELDQVPEKYRAAFILCQLEGKSCAEAAKRLGCPRGTVQSRVGRARACLRARLLQPPRGTVP